MRTLLELYTATRVFGLSLNFVTYNLLLASCLVYALLRGGSPEKIGAAMMAVGSVTTIVVLSFVGVSITSVEYGVLLIDSVFLVALSALAIRADRYWPLWVTALQLLTVAAHVAKLIEPNMIFQAYIFLMVVWSYPQILLIALGTWRHQKRLRASGWDRAWS
jgi:hypothetical protein